MSNFRDVLSRQYGSVNVNQFQRNSLKNIYENVPFGNIEQPARYEKTINSLELDSSEEFLLVCENDGNIRLNQIDDELSGKLINLQSRRFVDSYASRAQWHPRDTNLLQVAYSRQVAIIDTNTLKVCESHKFPNDIFWTDWSSTNPNLIAVGGASQCVRFVDVRSGSSLHQITISSQLGCSNNGATRVLWDHFDPDCIFVGDSYGYLHLYDIRSPRNSLQLRSSDSVCDGITCLQFTKDKMSLLTCQGPDGLMNLWSFGKKNLMNTHVNFSSAFAKRKNKLSQLAIGYVKYQVFFTDDHIIRPSISGRGIELIVNDLKNGKLVATYSAEERQTSKSLATVVTGTSSGLMLISGGRKTYNVWIPRLHE